MKVGVDAHGFAVFYTMEDGWVALETNLRVHCTRNPNQLLSQYVAQYAPASDGNDPADYAREVAAHGTPAAAATAMIDAVVARTYVGMACHELFRASRGWFVAVNGVVPDARRVCMLTAEEAGEWYDRAGYKTGKRPEGAR